MRSKKTVRGAATSVRSEEIGVRSNTSRLTPHSSLIIVQYAVPSHGLPAPADVERWAHSALSVRPGAEITVRIVDEAESAALNAAYRRRSGSTNVLSFPFEPPAPVPSAQRYLGDVVICAPVVAREAREQGKDSAAHWAHMVLHGCLHLVGYDHLDDAQAHEMETLETELLAGMGYADPYLIRHHDTDNMPVS